MSTVRIEVKPEIFSWVESQIDVDNLREALKENFYKWIRGEKRPTLRQIEALSQATHIPLGYFFLSKPPVENHSFIEFRTIDSEELVKPSRDLIDTINEMERVQDWMKDYLQDQSFDDFDYVGSVNKKDSIEDVVNRIRKRLGIPVDWYKNRKDSWDSFKYLRGRMETTGIIVMMNGVVGTNNHRPLNINEFRAFAMVDKLAPLVFVNAHDSGCGRLFSLVHEMAHIWYGVNSLFNDRYCVGNSKVIERNCNAIAAEIIVPNTAFVSKWNACEIRDTEEKIRKVAGDFNCGMTVITRRALDNGFIDLDTYRILTDKARIIYEEAKTKSGNGGSFYNTALSRIDKRFLLALNDSAYEGKTAFTDVYRLTNTTRKTFEGMVEKVRGNAS